MSLEYKYDFTNDAIKLWHVLSVYIYWADHFFYDLFQDVSFLPKLSGLTFKHNKSDLCTQLFLVKNDN